MPNHEVVKVFCPKSGKIEFANTSGGGKERRDPKCCKCGLRHPQEK